MKHTLMGNCAAYLGNSTSWACQVPNAVALNGHWYGRHDSKTERLVQVSGIPNDPGRSGNGVYRLCEAQRQAILAKAWGDTVVLTLLDEQEEATNPCMTIPSIEMPCLNCGKNVFTTDIKCWWCERLNPTGP
jgi:hypothetical protein